METAVLAKPREWYVPDEDGKKVTDDFILSKICEAELKQISEPYQLMIGTDSQLHGKQFRFVTVICLYLVSRGGYYWYNLSYEDRGRYKGKQQNRMFREAEIAMETASFVLEKTGAIAEIHIDASPKEAGHFTSAFSDQLKGYVISSGWNCLLKPGSIASTCAADRHSK